MEAHTIHNGVLRRVPEDWELKQVVKYTLFLVLGILLGLMWPLEQEKQNGKTIIQNAAQSGPSSPAPVVAQKPGEGFRIEEGWVHVSAVLEEAEQGRREGIQRRGPPYRIDIPLGEYH